MNRVLGEALSYWPLLLALLAAALGIWLLPGLMRGASENRCREAAQVMGLRHQFTPSGVCMVEIEPGKWRPMIDRWNK